MCGLSIPHSTGWAHSLQSCAQLQSRGKLITYRTSCTICYFQTHCQMSTIFSFSLKIYRVSFFKSYIGCITIWNRGIDIVSNYGTWGMIQRHIFLKFVTKSLNTNFYVSNLKTGEIPIQIFTFYFTLFRVNFQKMLRNTFLFICNKESKQEFSSL